MAVRRNDLTDLVAEFRSEYALSNAEAVRALDEGGWELVWSTVVSRAAEDLLVPGNAFAVRRRLERLADWYRRTACDPVRLFGSLSVQEAVATGLARIEQHLDEAAEANPAGGAAVFDPSEAWQCVLRHPRVFRDWPLAPGPEQHDPRYQWRVGCNLYASPHNLADAGAVEVGSAPSRVITAIAAAGETLRFLGDDSVAAQALGLAPPEWSAYRADVLRRFGPWVDVEGVAVHRCGYPPFTAGGPPDTAIAAWRRPIREAEDALRRVLPDCATEAAHRWLTAHCGGCGPAYVGIRYPLAFTSLIADVFAEHYLAHAEAPPVDAARAAAGAAEGGPHPHQVYSVWLRYGFVDIPEAERLTRG